jgi:tRNA G37 N-methylase TrmD
VRQALARTAQRRPELLANAQLAPEARRALNELQAATAAGTEDRGEPT